MNRRGQTHAGLVLADRYALVQLIATGGMSEVWYATDTRTGTPVAVKILRPELTGDPRVLRRLRMEARNTGRLRHRNLVALLDHGERDGVGFLVQEYIDGENLADVLHREGRMPATRLVPLLVDACHGLGAAHAADVVHRDVKPSNILLSRDGTVKVSDFGISFGAEQPRLTATGMVMGTAEYLSPEQATGRPATPASDVYALGIVAHEALSGRRPFTGRSQVDIALAQVEQEPPPLPGDVPVRVRTAVLRMLAKDPARRPASAWATADMLDQALQAYRQTAPPAPSSPPPPPAGATPPAAIAPAPPAPPAPGHRSGGPLPPPPPAGHPTPAGRASDTPPGPTSSAAGDAGLADTEAKDD